MIRKKTTPINETTHFIFPEGGPTEPLIKQWFIHQKIRPKDTTLTKGFEEIISLASGGYGVGIIPQIVLENSPIQDTLFILKRHFIFNVNVIEIHNIENEIIDK